VARAAPGCLLGARGRAGLGPIPKVCTPSAADPRRQQPYNCLDAPPVRLRSPPASGNSPQNEALHRLAALSKHDALSLGPIPPGLPRRSGRPAAPVPPRRLNALPVRLRDLSDPDIHGSTPSTGGILTGWPGAPVASGYETDTGPSLALTVTPSRTVFIPRRDLWLHGLDPSGRTFLRDRPPERPRQPLASRSGRPRAPTHRGAVNDVDEASPLQELFGAELDHREPSRAGCRRAPW